MPCRKIVRTKEEEIEYQNLKRIKNAETQRRHRLKKKENEQNSSLHEDAGSVQADQLAIGRKRQKF